MSNIELYPVQSQYCALDRNITELSAFLRETQEKHRAMASKLLHLSQNAWRYDTSLKDTVKKLAEAIEKAASMVSTTPEAFENVEEFVVLVDTTYITPEIMRCGVEMTLFCVLSNLPVPLDLVRISHADGEIRGAVKRFAANHEFKLSGTLRGICEFFMRYQDVGMRTYAFAHEFPVVLDGVEAVANVLKITTKEPTIQVESISAFGNHTSGISTYCFAVKRHYESNNDDY